MKNVQEALKAAEGTWIQITFTLDPAHYQKLWDRAETEHRTRSDVVRESVVDFLRES
jgi:predicted transcriptional regulator